MPRLEISDKFTDLVTLFNDIKKKHDDDGAGSPLTPFLVTNNIDLAADKLNVIAAHAFYVDQLSLEKLSEGHTQQRNLFWAVPFKDMKDMFQFLKKLYKSNYMVLGEWGAPILVSGRINYPSNILDQTAIFTLFKEKHDSFPAGTSPLEAFLTVNSINLDDDDDLKDKTIQQHDYAQDKSRLAEEKTEKRNLTFDPVLEHIYGIGNYLMKLYPGNEKKLGEYGFTVDNSPRKPKNRISKIMLGSSKTLNGLVIGSNLENIGPVAVELYRGKTENGTPEVIQPGESIGIPPKYGTVTIKNTSTLEIAKVNTITLNS